MQRAWPERPAAKRQEREAMRPSGPLWVRVVLAVYGVGLAQTGVWAAAFPRSFYDDFPGFGRVWVAVDGPYNEHLVRDVGSLNLALAVLLLAAAVRTTPLLVGVAAGVNLVNAVPHTVYHLRHLDVFETSDQVTNVIVLAATVVAPIALLWWVSRAGAGGEDVGDRRLDAGDRVGAGPVLAEPGDE
jgi:hypothetical protein